MNGVLKGYSMWVEKIKNDTTLKICLLSVFIIGFVAHGYCFANLTISHDSLREFIIDRRIIEHKVSLGRFFQVLYSAIVRGNVTIPWLVGISSLFWITIATYYMTKIFDIKNKLDIVILSGICVTNITVISTAGTYIHDLDANMFALTLSVLAVYLWKSALKENAQKKRLLWLASSIMVFASLGIYQSFISVTIVLVIFWGIIELFEGQSSRVVFQKMLSGAMCVILGGALYIVTLKIVTGLMGIPVNKDTYNSLGNMKHLIGESWLPLLVDAYKLYFMSFLYDVTVYSRWMFFLLYIGFVAAILRIVVCAVKKNKKVEGIFIILLGISIPLVCNISYFLSVGTCHDLMKYAFWLIVLLAICCVKWFEKQEKVSKKEKVRLRFLVCFCVIVMIWGNIKTANVVYVKKDLERQATLSRMTQVAERIENYEGYVPGETLVVIMGYEAGIDESVSEFSKYKIITGAGISSQISYLLTYESYFQNILKRDINILTDESLIVPEIENAMPVFPDINSVQMIDDILYVKMAEVDN